MAVYSVENYVMDNLAIQDTVSKLWRYYDMRWTEDETVQMLVDQVLAPQVTVDYKVLLGRDPYSVSGTDQAKNWYGYMEKLSYSVHMIGNVFCDLPKPGVGIERPNKTTANTQALVVLRKDDKLSKNGGVVLVDLQRQASKGEWEWRICGLKMVNKAFEEGASLFD